MRRIESGAGVLRCVLEEAREEQNCSRNDLTVLSAQVDPYRLDTPSFAGRHRNQRGPLRRHSEAPTAILTSTT